MTKTPEELLEIAFNAEKFGDRTGAIRIYRQVANGNSEHAEYARNCVKNLEELGVEMPAEVTYEDTSETRNIDANVENPFRPIATDSRTLPTDPDYSNARRSHFSANIVRGLAVFCLLCGLHSCLFFVRFSIDWSIHPILMVIDCLITAGLFTVAYIATMYANALLGLLPLSEKTFSRYLRCQFRFTTAMGLLALLVVSRELILFWTLSLR